MMTGFLVQLRDMTLVRYFMASAMALALDMSTFLSLLALGMTPSVASVAGYSLGIVAHWFVSSRFVFGDRVAREGVARMQQKSLFAGSAIMGLMLTTSIVTIGDWLGFDPRLAKLVAVGTSFVSIWLVRNQVIFRRERHVFGS